MSEAQEGWHRVLAAFEDWIVYESTEYGPYTGYFSLNALRDLTHKERIGWMRSMYEDIIPGRVERCKAARVAFEDFLPYMPDRDAIEVVRSMIELSELLADEMLDMSDTVHNMKEEYSDGELDELVPFLAEIADYEENIRHHMSLFSNGFGKLRAMGLEMPELE